jgi:RNA polymerase sigma factor (sigma-70 family)
MSLMAVKSRRAPLAGLALSCQPDSRLIALIREGHDRAFEEIVRRYREPLVLFAGAIVPQHRAEDVVQEGLAKAHTAIAAGGDEIKLKPWLYTIVRNRALNDLRDEPIHDHLDENFDGVPQPPEVAARRQELAALTASIRELPPAQRDAIVQRELEGRSHEEIAASLGTTAGSVRGLIFRARTALRNAAGILIPMPALRALLSAGPQSTDATGAAVGGAAAGLAGGGGIALKTGATLGIAVLAVGGGVALKNHNSSPDPGRAAIASREAGPHAGRAILADSKPARDLALNSGSQSGQGGGSSGPDDSSGPGSGSGSSGSSSGSSGGGSPSGSSSGPGGGTGHTSTSGPGRGDDSTGDGGGGGGGTSGSSGDDGSSSGTSGSGDDGSGTSGSGDDGSGTSGSGSGDGGSGSGTSGDGGGDDTTVIPPSDDSGDDDVLPEVDGNPGAGTSGDGID